MPTFNFVSHYVADPAKSAVFYTDLLGLKVIEQSPNFVMLVLREGVMLGLWKRDDVRPAAQGAPGDAEIGCIVPDKAAIEATHKDWAARGVRIAQPPIEMEFGPTFVALDPDGHRIRVFMPEQG